MATKSNIGISLYISTTLPATNDKAGFEALTWTEVQGVITGPQFGVSSNNIDVPDLKTGFTSGVKGQNSGMDSEMSFRIDGVDTGQTTLRNTADTAQGIIAIKVGRGSGVNNALVAGDPVEYAQGYVHSYKKNSLSGETFEGFVVNFKQNAPTVVDVEPS